MSSPPVVWPPLGESEAAAAVCSAAFLLMALLCVRNKSLTTYRLYLIGGALAATFRGVSMAVKAASIGKGESDEGMAIMVPFLAGAGYGIAIALQLLVIGGWLRNTADDAKPTFWRPLRLLLICVLFPAVIVFGPVLGLAAALLQTLDAPASQHALDTALKLRRTSATGFVIITSVSFLVVAWCLATAVRARAGFSLKKHGSHVIVWLLPGTLLMVWAATYRVQAVWVRPWTATEEALVYPLQTLPELLQLMLWCVPTLMARIHLSDRFQVWWQESHPQGPEVPPFGGFPTEQQPPPSWATEPPVMHQHQQGAGPAPNQAGAKYSAHPVQLAGVV